MHKTENIISYKLYSISINAFVKMHFLLHIQYDLLFTY